MDVVVTVPMRLWSMWLDEGDLAYADDRMEPARWAGEMEYGFTLGGGCARPDIARGERVYVVAYGQLRGWAPFEYFDAGERFGGQPGSFALVRRGRGVACTLDEPIRGFQGWRRRWWDRAAERPFAGWRTEGIPQQLGLL